MEFFAIMTKTIIRKKNFRHYIRKPVPAELKHAEGPIAFKTISDGMMRWAPIAVEPKKLDLEIISSSLHIKRIGIRRDVKELLDTEAVVKNPQALKTG